jgi:hypothetical protein
VDGGVSVEIIEIRAGFQIVALRFHKESFGVAGASLRRPGRVRKLFQRVDLRYHAQGRLLDWCLPYLGYARNNRCYSITELPPEPIASTATCFVNRPCSGSGPIRSRTAPDHAARDTRARSCHTDATDVANLHTAAAN